MGSWLVVVGIVPVAIFAAMVFACLIGEAKDVEMQRARDREGRR